MKEDKLLTIREVSQMLGIDEQQVIDLAEQGKITAYKIGGVYLRFKPDHIQELRAEFTESMRSQDNASFSEKLKDFLYFNDFYFVSLFIVIALLLIIFNV